MKTLVLFALQIYRMAISPYLGFRCRYVPCCSEYAQDAIRAKGVWKGILAGLVRIGRCAPWSGAGLDPFEPGIKKSH